MSSANKNLSLYKGIFNWYGQCFTLYTHAKDEWQAFRNFCHQLAKKVGYIWRHVYDYFDGTVDNYLITYIKAKEVLKDAPQN